MTSSNSILFPVCYSTTAPSTSDDSRFTKITNTHFTYSSILPTLQQNARIRNISPTPLISTACGSCQSDGRFSSSPPYYQLGPSPIPNTPYYNYTLPTNYPYVRPPCSIPPVDYWYFPFETEGC